MLQLLAAGAQLEARTANGFTPLMTAIVHLQAATVRQLLAHSSNVSAVDDEGWQALHRACGMAAEAPEIAIGMVVQLLAAGSDPNAPATAAAVTPLALTVHYGCIEIVRLLLKAGADPDAACADGTTPLMFAAQTKQIDKLAALLEAGAAVDGARPCGDTALMFAASNGHLAGLSALLKAGAAVNTANDQGVTCLMYASGLAPEVQDACQIVDALLAAGAAVATADNTGRTALMMAARSGGVAVVRSLLQAGAAVNTAAEDGSTCLIAACGRCCCGGQCCGEAVPVVLQLLAAGADVNASRQGAFSALMAAANSGSVEGVEALLKAGAAVNAASRHGVTALYYAVEAFDREHPAPQHQSDAVVAQLLKAGANTSAAAQLNGTTPLHSAAELGKCNIMQQLLAAGAQCNASTNDGEPQYATRLHLLQWTLPVLQLYSVHVDVTSCCFMLC
jgi:ankyrin repeat protein